MDGSCWHSPGMSEGAPVLFGDLGDKLREDTLEHGGIQGFGWFPEDLLLPQGFPGLFHLAPHFHLRDGVVSLPEQLRAPFPFFQAGSPSRGVGWDRIGCWIWDEPLGKAGMALTRTQIPGNPVLTWNQELIRN